jgi:hypothetical protein
MSKRNQSRRRRAYGRRQHEVRERQPLPADAGSGWIDDVYGELGGFDEAREVELELAQRGHEGRAAA